MKLCNEGNNAALSQPVTKFLVPPPFQNILDPPRDIVDNPPRKKKFSILDDVLKLDNYEQLSQQKYALFEYQNASKTFTM